MLYALGMGLMVLPLLVVSILSIHSLQQTTDISDRLIGDSLNEMHHAMTLQLIIAQASMPANDFLIHADPEEQDNARRANANVNKAFADMLSNISWTPQQLNIIYEAKQEWLKAQGLGDALLQIRDPVGDPRAAGLMELYDTQINRVVDVVEKLHHIAYREALEHHDLLLGINRDATTYIYYIALVGLLLAIAGSIIVVLAVFPALRQLEQGILRFGESNFDYRINAHMPRELQHVSDGLNAMATKLQTTHIELERQSLQDALTGVYNKRKFDIDFRSEIDRCRRYGQIFSLLIIDLDNFKAVNDTHGHSTGDAVLRKAAQHINLQLRASDELYRYGGDEFVLLLPETSGSDALIVAERIRCIMAADTEGINDNAAVTVSFSIGVAVFPHHGDNREDLFTAADEAVYAAKKGGRNRACISTNRDRA
jgi:diguanylate cyclase (GGDEF)-like protein